MQSLYDGIVYAFISIFACADMEGPLMTREDLKEVISILMNSPLYLTLSVQERYGLVLRLIHDYPLLTGKGDSNFKGSAEERDRPTLVN